MGKGGGGGQLFNKGHIRLNISTAISIKVVPEQSGKVEYEREKLCWE